MMVGAQRTITPLQRNPRNLHPKNQHGGSPPNERTHRYNKLVFRRICRWLPDDEREQLCLKLFRELERIELLVAA